MYSLLAFDMDDTLLDPSGKLTDRTYNALQRVMETGAYVVLASGRMPEAMMAMAEKIGVNAPMVLYNGGMVYDYRTDRTISRIDIPLETARAICAMAEEMGIYIQVYPGKGYYAAERTKYTDMYENHIKVPCNIIGKPASEWITTGQIKMLMIGEKEDSACRIEIFSKAFPDVSFMMSKPHYVEIVAKGVDKSFALDAAAKDMGLTAAQCMAFGDGQNDVSMLQYAGAGYCMLNASEGVRARCSLFAPSNAEDGCAQIIEKMLDEGLIGKE